MADALILLGVTGFNGLRSLSHKIYLFLISAVPQSLQISLAWQKHLIATSLMQSGALCFK